MSSRPLIAIALLTSVIGCSPPEPAAQPTGVTPTQPPATTFLPPREPVHDEAVFADPVLVTRAWMAQSCAVGYPEPINTHLRRAAAFQTEQGKRADRATGDTPDTYRRLRESRLESRCEAISAVVSPEAPASPIQVYVVVRARRVLAVDGVVFQHEDVHQVRRVVREGDRWLVDVAVEAS